MLLLVEFVITAVLGGLLYNAVNIEAAYSAVLGGLAYIVPNACFTRYAFRHSAAHSADLAVRWFYIGEVVKVLATIVIFAGCFLLIQPLNAAALFLTYILILIVNLWGLFVLVNHQGNSE